MLQGLSKQYFNTYFHNNSILFQFILKEFLDVSREQRALEKFVKETLSKVSSTSTLTEKQLELLGEQLTKLSGAVHDHLWQLPWHLDGGSLTKLKNYSYLFVRNSEKEERSWCSIHDQSEKAWTHCKETLDLIKDYLFYRWRTNEPLDLAKISEHLKKISQSIEQISKLMEKAIHRFRDDENVIFFILRHRTEFDEAYSPDFALQILGKMHPKGIDHLEVFLTKKYSQRGFDHLLPLISEKMTELKLST